MSMMKKMMAGLALALVFGAVQARSTVPLVEPERVVVAATADALTAEQVKQAIVRGGAKHEWTVVREEAGKVQLKYIKQNKHEVVVDVSYDTTGFQIRYVGSTNMKYEQANGTAMIHPFYNTWVSNLSRSISTEAATLAAAK
ncbi:hypothetical protein [Roseateles terrae]|uniref:PepSY domain-containing protein n=1 Tax=Roseateles terrae TaxID=431060 RepID=A0ABR6GQ47_9BURK|nr:hypothetical protein [Roseateles terrae]MBB3194250.1 hypothetical protein [Roseateles terrae]OWQ88094.1 hypothetical protein CDN98_08115 [Roseateles terrae]